MSPLRLAGDRPSGSLAVGKSESLDTHVETDGEDLADPGAIPGTSILHPRPAGPGRGIFFSWEATGLGSEPDRTDCGEKRPKPSPSSVRARSLDTCWMSCWIA